jgi:hypothetical protein
MKHKQKQKHSKSRSRKKGVHRKNARIVAITAVLVVLIALPLVLYNTPNTHSNSQTNSSDNVGYQFNYTSYPMVLNITLNETNGEIPGKYGYWALENYTRRVRAWKSSNLTYIIAVNMTGTWATFTGALSPYKGTAELENGTGTFYVNYVSTVIGSLNNSRALSGYVGSFNLNGTENDITKGNYSRQNWPTENTFNWQDYYFGTNSVLATPRNYTSVYMYKNETYYIHFYVNSTGSLQPVITYGDILT